MHNFVSIAGGFVIVANGQDRQTGRIGQRPERLCNDHLYLVAGVEVKEIDNSIVPVHSKYLQVRGKELFVLTG